MPRNPEDEEPRKRELGFTVNVTIEVDPKDPELPDYESMIEEVFHRRGEVVECEATLESNEEG